jgi:hypothetical protein
MPDATEAHGCGCWEERQAIQHFHLFVAMETGYLFQGG